MFARRVLVVEDQSLLRDLLVAACAQRGFHARGAATAIEATIAVSDFDPDIVVLDIDLGDGASGADLGHVLEHRRPDIALLYLTRFADVRAAGHPHTPGASVGYLRKDSISSTDDFLSHVETMLRISGSGRRDDLDPHRPLAELSDAQLDVLRLASLGLSNKGIAEVRRTSESAVEAHLTAIFRLLGISPSTTMNQRATAVRHFMEVAGRPLMASPRELLHG
jgi:DNA-binding NarL/FixJ family response regulator